MNRSTKAVGISTGKCQTLIYARQAQKDARLLAHTAFKPRTQRLVNLISEDPYRTPPRYERLVGDFVGLYSRRINFQHRLVYDVDVGRHVVHVLRMRTRHSIR